MTNGVTAFHHSQLRVAQMLFDSYLLSQFITTIQLAVYLLNDVLFCRCSIKHVLVCRAQFKDLLRRLHT